MSRAVSRRSFAREAARTPILLYRARLGWLLGHRFLLLEHIGRTSGRPRYVVLEVVHRPAPDRYVVVSGFGERANWFRNVSATPRGRVSVGRQRLVPARARVLSAEEVSRTLEEYQQEHALAWKLLAPVIRRVIRADPRTADRDLFRRLPMVELSLTGARPGATGDSDPVGARPGAAGDSDAVARLRRWQDAGAVWRVVARRGDTVTVALCQCDGGEEVDRFTSTDPDLVAFLAGRASSED